MIEKAELISELQSRLKELHETVDITWENIGKKLYLKGEFVGMLHVARLAELINEDEYLKFVTQISKKKMEEI